MKSKLFRLLALFVVLAMFLGSFSARPAMAVTGPTTDEPATENIPDTAAAIKGVTGGLSETGIYIVQLKAASLAAYNGGVPSFTATSTEVTGARKLDVNTPESQAYLSYLEAQQSDFIAQMETAFGRSVEVVFQYRNVLNALAVRVSFAEAASLSKFAGVKTVFADKIYQLDTDVGPTWIDAPSIWNGDTGPGVATQGEGVIIGMIDSGINHAHPSFADLGGDGYNHTNPFGAGIYVGYCLTTPAFCNDKLIGAYDLYPGGSGGPEDTGGHGSHTASTVGGNRHDANIIVGTTPFTRTISGVAPHANIIAYKVCNPSCPESSSVAAVDNALNDGVDVLNYSISGADDPWNDVVDLAFLDATAAGIFVSASAGNAGPGAGTVAHTGPWNATVAASTHTRIFANTLDITAPAPVPPELVGLAVVQGTGPALTADLTAPIAYNPTNLNGCTAFPAGYFTGKLALIQRGSCTFVIKVTNAYTAGAAGVVTFNNAGGPPIVMGGLEATLIPSAMLGLGDGLEVQAWIDTNPTTAAGRLNVEVNVVVNPDFADIMAGFSSRGPSQFDLIKPDYTAPGVNILAAVAAAGGDPVQYDLYQGTSMSSPHSAGSAVLMVALHPTWSPAEIKSAMASSAYNGALMFKENAVDPADPLDMGSGRLELGQAATAGLVWDETYANFVAANPATGGDPKSLNLSTLANQNCVGTCSWTRTVSSVLDVAATYTASFTSTVDVVGTVIPAVFTIPAGGTQVLSITVDVTGQPLGTWVFGTFNLDTDAVWAGGESAADQHMAMGVVPTVSSMPDLATIKTDKKAGSQAINGLQVGEEITDLTIVVDGLNQAALYKPMVAEDPTPALPYNGDGGTFVTTVVVPAGALRLVAQVMESTSADVDMYVGTGTTPGAGTVVCTSASGAVLEYCNIDDPDAGTYWVLVQNFAGSADPTDLIATAVGTVIPGDVGNLTVTGPETVLPGVPFDLTMNWDEPTLVEEAVYYAVFTVGTDPVNPGNLGRIAVNFSYTPPIVLTKLGPDFALPGDVIAYNLVLAGENPISNPAWLTDTLPVGVAYAGGLAATSGTATYDDVTNRVLWNNAPVQVALDLGGAPAAPAAPVTLVLDDGSRDNDIGIGGTWEMGWWNRFTPAAAEFPFELNQIQVYFSSLGMVLPGDAIQLTVYQDADGNPANGAVLLAVVNTTVQAANTWNVYNLTTPVTVSGPGDVLVGVIALEVPGTSYWPASMDQTTTQQRSWAGWWLLQPPDPNIFPPDDSFILIDTYFPGNWMVRGYGETVVEYPQVITVTFNVTVTAESGYVTNVADLNYEDEAFAGQHTLTVIAPPVAAFTSNTPVLLGAAAVFTPTVTGTGPFEYLWSFGDGITSTLEAPTHLYDATGSYTVTLTATSDFGADTYVSQFVVVGIPPAAAFISNSPVLLGEIAVFTPTVTGTGPFEYVWDFGDGITSTLESPTHLYGVADTYTVVLTVTSDWGTDTYTAEFVVTVEGNPVYLPLVFKPSD